MNNFTRTIQETILRKSNLQRFMNLKKCSQATNVWTKNAPHVPVMAQEVLKYLEPSPGKVYVDMTFGAGGHSIMLLNSSPDIKLLALDRDPTAHEYAQELSETYPGQVIPLLGRFSELPELLTQHKIERNSIDGFLFDFGCSSMQFDTPERGFSLARSGPLDMRMDGTRCPSQLSAADILQTIEEVDLVRILKVYGGEKRAKRIARAIIETRQTFRKLETTQELAQLVESTLQGEIRRDQLGRITHPATKTFQALRIFVNNELNEINYGIILAATYIKTNGRLVTISFHSLEDTIVKRHMAGNITDSLANKLPLKYAGHGKVYNENEFEVATKTPWKMLHKHVITATPEELQNNARARSAKLRAIVKVT